MWIEKLFLVNFKNYEEAKFEFVDGVNCILGDNGSGKTSLLDAIYFLGLTKSAFQPQDAICIRNGADYSMLDGRIWKDDRRYQTTFSMQKGQRKVIMVDKKPYEKLSEHIGRFPVVMIEPNDTDLVRDGSEVRRKFFDGVISQIDAGYLQSLMQYNRIQTQRNSLLRIFAERGQADPDLLDTYDLPFVQLAGELATKRSAFVEEFLGHFVRFYAYLSEEREEVNVAYQTEVQTGDFATRFRSNRSRDLSAQRTTMGVHRDEYQFELNDQVLKRFGSQGQQKTFVIALKLAQFEIIYRRLGIRPILLLDDIFDKLDDRRIKKLVDLMEEGVLGQVFVTDARPERSHQILDGVSRATQFIELALVK